MQNSQGFSLIELLVVIAIIGILSSTVLASVNSTRAEARDARRMQDLHNIQIAMEMYHNKYGTYKVANSGWQGGGRGWLGYENGGSYTRAVTRALEEEGFLADPLVDDPIQDPGYMIYLCEGNQVYSLSATKENPSEEDIEHIKRTCNGVGGNGTHTRYGKNYAVGNKAY